MYEITYTKPDVVKIGPFTSSKKELRDLLKAWLAISVAFGIVIAGGYKALTSVGVLYYFSISAVAVGAGFLLHEIAHKVVAQKYHCWAEFRSFDNMLWLALAMSLFGFVFAAPGAVMIVGTVTKDRNGKISLAGPLTNVVLAVLFLSAMFFIPSTGYLAALASYGFLINVILALFNLIPVGNFDGKKIWKWSKPAWVATAVAAGGLFVLVLL